MCDTPVKLKKGDIVPCGSCADCLSAKRNSWIRRLYYEAYYSDFAYFVTLTYDDEHLSFADSDFPVLNYRDIQLYFKRARKAGFRFKYFGVGEYGEHYSRPHYHILFFTCENPYRISSMLNLWECGFTDIQHVSEANIRYTTKDMLKETDLFKDVERALKPHVFCSKGIGLKYVEKHIDFFRVDSFQPQKMAFQGSPVVLPRYFKEKIYNKYERKYHRIVLENSRRDVIRISSRNDAQNLEKIRRQAQIFTQKVEQKRQKQLKINHFNKKL